MALEPDGRTTCGTPQEFKKSSWPCGKRKSEETRRKLTACSRNWMSPAHTLMAIKNMPGGADYIRKRKLRTHLAEEKYGPDWMELTEEEEFARQGTAGKG